MSFDSFIILVYKNSVVFPVLQYQVRVYTGDVGSAGTDSDVYIYIHGDMGSTGKRLLKKSKTHDDKFERDQVHCDNHNV